MFPWMPVHRPRVGVAFTREAVSLVELAPWWRGRTKIRRAATLELPNGLLTTKPASPNVADVDELATIVRQLFSGSRRRTVAISLPASCAHVALFPFETLSANPQDRLAVLRWRFQQDEHVALGDAALAYRVFQGQSAAGAPSVSYVLAVAIQRQILRQYEEVLERAGAIALSLGWSTLLLCDLWHAWVKSGRELFVVHEGAECLTIVGVRQGVPVYLRTKSGRSGASSARREVLRSLQHYDDLRPHHAPNGSGETTTLYWFRDPGRAATSEEGATTHSPDLTPLLPRGNASWQVEVHTPSWAVSTGKGLPLKGSGEWSAFAAVAAGSARS